MDARRASEYEGHGTAPGYGEGGEEVVRVVVDAGNVAVGIGSEVKGDRGSGVGAGPADGPG